MKHGPGYTPLKQMTREDWEKQGITFLHPDQPEAMRTAPFFRPMNAQDITFGGAPIDSLDGCDVEIVREP